MTANELDTENSIDNADNEAAAAKKKLTVRQPFESALKYHRNPALILRTLSTNPFHSLQSDIHIIFVGSPPQISTIHTSLLPMKTLAILALTKTQPFPTLPIDFHTIPGGDTTHETFEIYRNFLYTGKLFTHDAHGDQDYADTGDEEAHEDREWVRLVLAYFLGLRLGDEGFCNCVVGGVVEKVGEAVSYSLLVDDMGESGC